MSTAPHDPAPHDPAQHDPAQHDPAARATTTERPVARGPRPGTVVWGLIVIAVGVLTIVTSTGFDLDLELTAIIGLAVAGALLLLTAVVGATRTRRR